MGNIKKIVTLSFITAIIGTTPINAMLSRAARIGGNIAERQALTRTTHHSPQLIGTKFKSFLPTQIAKKQTFSPTQNSTFSTAQSPTTLWSRKKAAGLLGTAGALGCYALNNQEKAHAQDGTDYSVELLKQDPNKITVEVINNLVDKCNTFRRRELSNKLKLLLEDETTAPIVIQVAAQNITKMDAYALPCIMDHNPDSVKIFTEAAAQNITKMSECALHHIMEHSPDAAKI